jgi:hypothetical protein
MSLPHKHALTVLGPDIPSAQPSVLSSRLAQCSPYRPVMERRRYYGALFITYVRVTVFIDYAMLTCYSTTCSRLIGVAFLA